MDWVSVKQNYVALRQQVTSPQCLSAYRAIVVVCLTLFIISNTPQWTQRAIMVSPFLGLNVVILSVAFVAKLWRNYSTDINMTVFRAARLALQTAQYVRHQYLSSGSGATSWDSDTVQFSDTASIQKLRRNRQLTRMAVMYLMVQHCMAPSCHWAWLYSLLAYKFTWECAEALRSRPPIQRPNPGGAGDNPPGADVSVSDVQRQGWSNFREKIARHALLAANCAFIAASLLYQWLYVGRWYLCVTVVCYLLSQRLYHKRLTKYLELLQLEVFEGMEQYYVAGVYAAAELLVTFIFMLWSLVRQDQYLMLIALYTNLYSGGKEMLNNIITAAFSEWALLAHFMRATGVELKDLDDVCPICLCSMRSARKTPCRHYFHGHCLRKCLKEKAVCPMCGRKLL